MATVSPTEGNSLGIQRSPSPDNPVKRCSACHGIKPKVEFPKRQWQKKHRRCKDCIANNVPYQRPSRKDYSDINTSSPSRSISSDPNNHSPKSKTFRPLESSPALSSSPGSNSTLPTDQSEVSSTGISSLLSGKRTTASTHGCQEFDGLLHIDTTPSPNKTTTTKVKIPATITTRQKTGTPSLQKSTNTFRLETSGVLALKTPSKIAKVKASKPQPATDRVVESVNDAETATSLSQDDIPEPAVSLDGDIEDLARNWTPPVVEPPPTGNASSRLETSIASSEADTSESGNSSFQDTLLLLASPLFDESGSARSIVAGLCSLFVLGSILGLISDKNSSLPREWYQYVSAMVGYIYFLCWSVSFYPQVISNYKRHSTEGLSSDFCALNVVGFACYTAYNASMFWSPVVQELYRERYGSEVTVQSNDVAFAIHALSLSAVTLGQILYYRDAQRPSPIIMGMIFLVLALCAFYPILILHEVYNVLDYVYVLSFVKIGISLIKYIPQVILNYQRKSTVGWSIWNILLDFTGGTLSDLQLVFDCADVGDFSGITGNLAKFGLGFVSIIFDIIFMVQHYILYADSSSLGGEQNGSETEPLLSEEERRDVEADDIL